MLVDLDSDVCEKVQTLTPVTLDQAQYKLFADWLISLGVQAVEATLQRHQGMELADIAMILFRNHAAKCEGKLAVDIDFIAAASAGMQFNSIYDQLVAAGANSLGEQSADGWI